MRHCPRGDDTLCQSFHPHTYVLQDTRLAGEGTFNEAVWLQPLRTPAYAALFVCRKETSRKTGHLSGNKVIKENVVVSYLLWKKNPINGMVW